MQFLNVAARHNGGSAKSAFNQDYYPIDRAIDGVTTGHEGWAYHGRLDKAVGMFEFKQEYRVSRPPRHRVPGVVHQRHWLHDAASRTLL
jgi:hypothetical protein